MYSPSNSPLFKNAGGDVDIFISKCKLVHAKRVFSLNNNNMFVFSHSTLGYEAFAKNKRIAVFNENFPINGFDIKYENQGFFWTKDFSNYNNFKTIMDNVLYCDNYKWKKIQTKHAPNFLIYSPDNKELYKIINQVL